MRIWWPTPVYNLLSIIYLLAAMWSFAHYTEHSFLLMSGSLLIGASCLILYLRNKE